MYSADKSGVWRREGKGRAPLTPPQTLPEPLSQPMSPTNGPEHRPVSARSQLGACSVLLSLQ